MSDFLRDLIPESNRLNIAFARSGSLGSKARMLEDQYGAGFVGAFVDKDDHGPTWARRAARFMKDDFFGNTPGRKKLFSDVASQLANGDGERHVNCRHALELWEKSGRKGPKPFTTSQDVGSCVDASASEHETSMFGWRVMQPTIREAFAFAAAWYKYANRGYCSDGWGGSGIAAVARRIGCAFRTKYELPGLTVDFTDDDENENIVARKWCRSGVPDVMAEYTQQHHGYEDGAITSYDGDHGGFKKVLAAGGALHAGGVRTSGGSKPCTPGRTGPHMQSTVGYDDTDECKQWFADKGVKFASGDFPLINMQTWGSGWRGECADEYWPTHLWGEKPEGAWVCSAKWWLGDVEYAWLPWAKGYPGTGPGPTPSPIAISPPLIGSLHAQTVAPGQIAIRGEIDLVLPAGVAAGSHKYIVVPKADGTYQFIQKPVF